MSYYYQHWLLQDGDYGLGYQVMRTTESLARKTSVKGAQYGRQGGVYIVQLRAFQL